MTVVLGALLPRGARRHRAGRRRARRHADRERRRTSRCTTRDDRRARARDDRDAARDLRPGDAGASRRASGAATRSSPCGCSKSAADEGVRMSREAIEQGLADAQWPARLELLQLDDGRQVLLDAAHNPEGARALAAYLQRWHPERPPLVIGVMRDKDVAGDPRHAAAAVSSVIATAAPTPRAMPPEDLARHLRAAGATRRRRRARRRRARSIARSRRRRLVLRRRLDLPRRRRARRPQAPCYPAVILVLVVRFSCSAAVVRACACPGRRPPSRSRPISHAPESPPTTGLPAARSTQLEQFAEVECKGDYCILTGQVELPLDSQTTLFADEVELFRDTNRVVAQGNVVFATPKGASPPSGSSSTSTPAPARFTTPPA